MAGRTTKTVEMEVGTVERGRVTLWLVGESPIILNRMSEKAKHELLLPPVKSKSDRRGTLKHDVMAEFAASPYTYPEPTAPTYISQIATSFKNALGTAALRVQGATKTEVLQLTYVVGHQVPIYGTPQMIMSVVRSADINRTPDIRTRTIIPNWATCITITFVKPIVTERAVINLLAAAGVFGGVGDWRPQKGSGDFGRFRIANDDDPELLEIKRTGGRELQLAAMAQPTFYDGETENLFVWYQGELDARGIVPPSQVKVNFEEDSRDGVSRFLGNGHLSEQVPEEVVFQR